MHKRNLKIWMMAGILVLFAASVAGLHLYGMRSRVYAGPVFALSDRDLPVFIVETSREMLDLYERKKIKGRILVHVGKYLHAVDVPFEKILAGGWRYPDNVSEIFPLYHGYLSYDNSFWIASQVNIVREILYCEPPAAFRKRLENIDAGDIDVISKSEEAIVLQDWGQRSTISAQLPRSREPVVLNIDASVFDETDPAALLFTLRQSSLASDLITLNLSRDNPDVTEKSRNRLKKFSALLSGGIPHGN